MSIKKTPLEGGLAGERREGIYFRIQDEKNSEARSQLSVASFKLSVVRVQGHKYLMIFNIPPVNDQAFTTFDFLRIYNSIVYFFTVP